MKNMKTKYMWFIIIIVFISAYENFTFVSENYQLISSGENIISSVIGILALLALLVSIKYIQQIFLCKKSVYLWTNIYFSTTMFLAILGLIPYFLVEDLVITGLVTLILLLIVRIFIWVTFYNHLKKVTNSGEIVLN